MISENIKVIGIPTFVLYDENMEVKQKFTVQNLIVSGGKNLLAARLSSNATATISHIGIGSSPTAASAGQTALLSPIVRVATTISGGTVSGPTVSYSATYGPGVGTGSIAEAGLFNAASAGIMLSRVAVVEFTKSAGDTLTISWDVSFV